MSAVASIKHPHRNIWAIAGPAIVANSSAPLVGLVDTWIIGHLPSATYLAAVSIGGLIFSYIFWAFGFIRMSTTGLVAQAHGRQDEGQIGRMLARALILGFVIGIVILLAKNQVRWAGLAILNPPHETLPHFDTYFDIRVWTIPATLVGLGINGYLIGTARAKLSLYLQLTLNFANAGFSLLFVLGFNMGIAGVALGSLVAEWLALIVGLYFIGGTLQFPKLIHAFQDPETYQFAKIKKILSVNGFIFMRTLLLIFAFAVATREAAKLGEVSLAAHHVLNIFMMLIALGLDGFAYASEALAGAAYGKGAQNDFRVWVKYGLIWSGIMALFYAAGFWVFGAPLITLLTDIEPVRNAAISTVPIIALLPLVGAWCYQFDGIYIGATAGSAMFGTILVSVISFYMVLDPLTERFGLSGLWMALSVFLAVRGISQALWYPQLEKKLRA